MHSTKKFIGLLMAAFAFMAQHATGALLPVRGILVQFRSPEARTKATVTRLHENTSAYVVKRFAYRQTDWVLPSQSELATDWRYLAGLCRYYKKSNLVKRCEPNPQLVTHAEHSKFTGFLHKDSARPSTNKLICPLVPEYQRERLMNGTLSPFWAQEYIGADLTQEVIAPDVKSKKFKPSSMGLLDTNTVPSRMNIAKDASTPAEPTETHFANTNDTVDNHHGLLAGNLANGAAPAGVAPQVPYSHLFEMTDGVASWVALGDALSKDGKMDPAKVARIYNVSMAVGYTSDITLSLLDDLAKHSVLVVASGNDWPKPLDRNETLVNSVMVGSLYPQGYVSHDSSEGDSLDIAAPSDNLIQSTVGNGKFEHFGGTSGAAPLVTGTLGLVMGYLPDLDVEEARLILKGTAIKTSNSFQNPPKNGAGMLNTLKAVMVAQKLHGKSKADRMALLSSSPDTGIFDFKSESAKAAAQANEYLSLEDSQKNCEKRLEGFKSLRTAFLLHPTEEVRQKLIELYKAQGLSTNAEFYENLDRSSLLKNLAKDSKSPNQGMKQSVARTSSYLPEAFPIVADLIQDATAPEPALAFPGFPLATPNILDSRTAAIRSLTAQYSPSKLKQLVAKLQSDPAPERRALAPLAALQLEIGAMSSISSALGDKDPSVVQAGLAALTAVGKKEDAKRFEYFAAFLSSGNKDVRLAAASVGASIASDAGLRTVVKSNLLKADDPNVRAVGIEMLGDTDGAELLRLARTETDEEVLKAILAKAAESDQRAIFAVLYESTNPAIRGRAVAYSGQNSTEISLLRKSLTDPDKSVREIGATTLLGLGITDPKGFDRFKSVDGATIKRMDEQVLQTVLERWGKDKQVGPLLTKSWAITWLKKHRESPHLSADRQGLIDELISAAEAERRKGVE